MTEATHSTSSSGSSVGKLGGGLIRLAVGILVLTFTVLFAASFITGERVVIQVPAVSVAGDQQPSLPRTGGVKPSDLYKNF